MKKYFTLFFLLFSFATVFGQSNDPELNSRLTTYMQLSRESKFDEVMDYTYPALFTVAPREQLLQAMRQMYDNDYYNISIDTAVTISISSDFVVGKAHYRKVIYRLVTHVHMKDTSLLAGDRKQQFVDHISASLRKSFNNAEVSYNTEGSFFDVRANAIMLAIKDDATQPWYFLGYQKDQPALAKFYPAAVSEHFGL